MIWIKSVRAAARKDGAVNKELTRKRHWEEVYRQKAACETSWYQEVPQPSLSMIENADTDLDTPVIDIGGGASLLVDKLLEMGFIDLTILDVSASALAQAKQRLAMKAERVSWLEADVTTFRPARRYGLWHDRAAFHFLTEPEDRQHYLNTLEQALQPGGQAVIAVFSPQGPKKCSGLDIVQYDADGMVEALGPTFQLLEEREALHVTPMGNEQWFNYFRLVKVTRQHKL